MAVKKIYFMEYVNINNGRHKEFRLENCGSKKVAEKVCVEAIYRTLSLDYEGNKERVSFIIDGVKVMSLPSGSCRKATADDWRLESYKVQRVGSAMPKERKNRNADGTKKRVRKTTTTPKATATTTPKATTTTPKATTTTPKATTTTPKALAGIKVAA